MTLKYKTKKQRLCAVFDVYYNNNGKRPVTMQEVAAWAIASGLSPVPTRTEAPEICELWEKLLEKHR